MTTVSANSTVGLILTSPAYANPIVVEVGVAISAYGTAGVIKAVSAQTGSWTIQNYGRIAAGPAASGEGILISGGAVTNAASASIYGSQNAIEIFNGSGDGSGTVVNAGVIAGTGTSAFGVDLFGFTVGSGGAVVTNQPGGTISATSVGVIFGGSGTDAASLVNYGLIAGAGTGVSLRGGSVTNHASGSITAGYRGVQIAVSAGTVVNYGHIAGLGAGTTAVGVFLLAGGSVTNQTSGSITGDYRGVDVNGAAGTVVNYGYIAGVDTGTVAFGVFLHEGGSVTNQTSGSITAGDIGILSQGVVNVVNYGRITSGGTKGIGVNLEAGGSITNATSALIAGSFHGIDFLNNAGVVVNDGSVSAAGTNGIAVNLAAGGSVTNSASASITSSYHAVEISGGIGTVLNYGAVIGTGTASRAVKLHMGGSVRNATSATILEADPKRHRNVDLNQINRSSGRVA